MRYRRLRRLIVIILFILSISMLLWSVWPLGESTLILPISPREMQLPTPESFLPLLSGLLTA